MERSLTYGSLVVAAGLKLDWAAIEGLEEALGRNGCDLELPI
jgi:sulfide:quinone oxidoreductase